jgi:cytoskeletal protein CcmA (bactofilin family)
MEDKQAGRSSAATNPAVRVPSYLSPGLKIKGEVTGNEDLHVDGSVEGAISVGGFRLTVGKGARVKAETVARELVVYGEVDGDLRARDLVEIKKEGSVQGDIATARIMIEDGAFFKGSIEIDRGNSPVGADLDTLLARGKEKSK